MTKAAQTGRYMIPQHKQAALWTSMLLGLPMLVIGVVLLFMKSDWDKRPPRAGSTIIAFGDSLVEGVGASDSHDWVSLVTKEMNIQIINAGKSGDLTATALERLERDVLAHDPRVVIVLLGGNDALKKVPKAETFANLGAIIDRIQKKGAAVLLIGIQGGLIGDSYKADFKKLAREKGAWFVQDVLDGIFGDPRLMSDYIHPNDAGYARVADRIEPVLQEIMAVE